jgi:hypothetical protein
MGLGLLDAALGLQCMPRMRLTHILAAMGAVHRRRAAAKNGRPAIDDTVAARLAEVEDAAAEGRLWELVKDTPAVVDQIRPFLTAHE